MMRTPFCPGSEAPWSTRETVARIRRGARQSQAVATSYFSGGQRRRRANGGRRANRRRILRRRCYSRTRSGVCRFANHMCNTRLGSTYGFWKGANACREVSHKLMRRGGKSRGASRRFDFFRRRGKRMNSAQSSSPTHPESAWKQSNYSPAVPFAQKGFASRKQRLCSQAPKMTRGVAGPPNVGKIPSSTCGNPFPF